MVSKSISVMVLSSFKAAILNTALRSCGTFIVIEIDFVLILIYIDFNTNFKINTKSRKKVKNIEILHFYFLVHWI